MFPPPGGILHNRTVCRQQRFNHPAAAAPLVRSDRDGRACREGLSRTFQRPKISEQADCLSGPIVVIMRGIEGIGAVYEPKSRRSFWDEIVRSRLLRLAAPTLENNEPKMATKEELWAVAKKGIWSVPLLVRWRMDTGDPRYRARGLVRADEEAQEAVTT